MKVNLFCNFTSWIVRSTRTAGSKIVLLLPYVCASHGKKSLKCITRNLTVFQVEA